VSQLPAHVYAPYADPEEYILRWTERIWPEHGMGLIREMYAPDLVVHGAYGDVMGVDAVIRGSVAKHSAFPNRVGTPEDVVWEARGDDAFVSYHRALHVGPHEGPWHYGPATHRMSVSRGIAICLVRDALVVEEWVVRDEAAIVDQLGFSLKAVAERIAASDDRKALASDRDGLLGSPPEDPVRAGDSGPRPGTFSAEAELAQELFAEVWDGRMFQRLSEFLHPDVIVSSAGRRTATRPEGYLHNLLRLLGAFPDARVEVRDIAVNRSDFHGLRIAVLWRLVGTYSGAPVYGPLTGSPVDILGSSMFLLRDGRIYREWQVFDDVAVHAQILRGRQESS
jgi:predicted ester cyclase